MQPQLMFAIKIFILKINNRLLQFDEFSNLENRCNSFYNFKYIKLKIFFFDYYVKQISYLILIFKKRSKLFKLEINSLNIK